MITIAGYMTTIAGIDPGVKTGVAFWDTKTQRFLFVATMTIVSTMYCINENITHLYIEDARLRKWFGKAGRAQLQGAGSIKRDCSIWEEFCQHKNIPFTLVSPQQKGRKVDAKTFKGMTGWEARTSEHARDAAMLVYGRKS